MGIHPYALLSDEPSTKYNLSWVDNRPGADGSAQNLAYGTDSGNLNETVSATGQAIPSSDAYVYHAKISGLSPDTAYFGRIDNEKDTPAFKTLPLALNTRELLILIASDLHIDRDEAMPSSDGMIPLSRHNADLLCMMGDIAPTGGESEDSSTANKWVRFLSDYQEKLNANGMIPMFTDPGNHDVGNNSWAGTLETSDYPDDGGVKPNVGYYQLLFPNTKDLDPIGQNYGQITIGDKYVQLLALDTHSAYPEDVANWMQGAIDDDAKVVLPFFHSPMLRGGNRIANDLLLQELLREKWGTILGSKDNIYCLFTGHIHLRNRSVPWALSNTHTSDSFGPYDGEYIRSNAPRNRIVEFGGGYRRDRTAISEWWVDYADSDDKQYYLVSIGQSHMNVKEIDQDGNIYDDHTFVYKEPVITRTSKQIIVMP